MKVATWNVNSLRVRLPHVRKWLEREQPDVLALQETKIQDEAFPADAFGELGYVATFSGQSAYNGVAILSREPPSEVLLGLGGGYVDDQKRVLGASFGTLRLWSLYVPNGQAVDSDKYRYKLKWLAALRQLLADELARHPALLIVGDFNIAPDDRDVHNPAAWHGKIMCSPAERAAL
ncbi:MAG: exodeoxyribonuclease III, partial [Lysobacterales bacterium]